MPEKPKTEAYFTDCQCGCGGYWTYPTYYKQPVSGEEQEARFSAPMNYLKDINAVQGP